MNRMPVGAQFVLLALMWVRASWSRRSASRWLSVVQVVLARMASGALALPRIAGQALRLRGKGLKPVMKPHAPPGAVRRESS